MFISIVRILLLVFFCCLGSCQSEQNDASPAERRFYYLQEVAKDQSYLAYIFAVRALLMDSTFFQMDSLHQISDSSLLLGMLPNDIVQVETLWDLHYNKVGTKLFQQSFLGKYPEYSGFSREEKRTILQLSMEYLKQ